MCKSLNKSTLCDNCYLKLYGANSIKDNRSVARKTMEKIENNREVLALIIAVISIPVIWVTSKNMEIANEFREQSK